MRILTFSTLFPNTLQQRHGIFVEQRLHQLLHAYPDLQAQVVAPVPWFPFANRRFGQYSVYTQVPNTEQRFGVPVCHPRFAALPLFGWRIHPYTLFAATRATLSRIQADGFEFDVIDSHFVYPDGVAAVRLGQHFDKPVFMTARGNDVSLMLDLPASRRHILAAARACAGIITVCQALKDALVSAGVDATRVHVLRNGVDLDRFRPLPREAARAEISVHGRTLLSVGHLIERKGNHLTIRALREIPDTTLLLVGDGPEERRLRDLARDCGVGERVRFVGALAQDELAKYYNAADALVLASSREGWANVLLEAMACGTPVIATPIWGTPEVVAVPEAGVLTADQSTAAIVAACQRLFAALPARAATRAYAETFSWDSTSDGQYRLFTQALRARQ